LFSSEDTIEALANEMIKTNTNCHDNGCSSKQVCLVLDPGSQIAHQWLQKKSRYITFGATKL